MKDVKDKSFMGAAGNGIPAGLLFGALIGYFIKGEKGALIGAGVGAVGLTYLLYKKSNKK